MLTEHARGKNCTGDFLSGSENPSLTSYEGGKFNDKIKSFRCPH